MLRIIIRKMSVNAKSTNTPIPVFGIAGRYVSALYSAALQMKQIDQVEQHLRSLQRELIKPKVIDFLETNMIPCADKVKVLKDIGQETGMPTAAINFLAVVAENGRLKLLRRMINMFLNVMVAHRNEALCEVITAKPLDDKSRKALLEALKKFVKGNKKLHLTEKVDPSVIGGVIIGFEDKHIDLSIAYKIKTFTEIIKQAI